MSPWPGVPADDPEELAKVVNRVRGAKDPDAVGDYLIGLSHWLSAALHERKHSDPKAADASLLKMGKFLNKGIKHLGTLCPDARRAAEQQVGTLEEMERVLLRYAEGFARAKANISVSRQVVDPPEKPGARRKRRGGGRPTDWAAHEAVRGLRSLWEDETGSPATATIDRITGERGGDFLAFVEAAILPVYKANGLVAPSLADIVLKELYPRKPRKTSEPEEPPEPEEPHEAAH